jgi:hypothetical protein
MSVHYDRGRDRWVVRWREAGQQRPRRFPDEAAARWFKAQSRRPAHVAARLHESQRCRHRARHRGRAGVARRGPRDERRLRRLLGQAARGQAPVRHGRPPAGLLTHGRKRLLPWFGALRLTAIDEDRVRDWLTETAELAVDGELSSKTVNNARTCLSMTLGEASAGGTCR